MEKFVPLLIILIVFLVLGTPSPALAQGESPDFTIRLTRDFGYGGFVNDIQGLFSFHVSDAPDDLDYVEFYVDEQLVASVSQAPFEVQFDTDDYAPGVHELYAIGYASDGSSFRSNSFTREFLSAEDARGGLVAIVGPILGILAVVLVISFLIPTVLNRGKKPVIGEYGLAGGAVCKRCGLPFQRTMWMPNMLVGKLGRCPHCGKIAIVPRATPTQLEEAEARYRAEMGEGGPASTGESEDERLKRQIDDSRFD